MRVKTGAVPVLVGMLASTSPGLMPPSSTYPVTLGPTAGGVQRKVTVLPVTECAIRPVGG